MSIDLEHIISRYANILADVELGKNLNNHLRDVDDCLKQINVAVDHALQLGNEDRGYKAFGYELYRLKDAIINKVNNKKNNL